MSSMSEAGPHLFEMGYFGNIWVRQNVLARAGQSAGGHKHKFDHISLLTSGKIKIEVEGKEPKEFTAPTFIVVRKEQKHNITALEDNTIYYCVFALRDLDGEVMEIFGPQHDPNCSEVVPDDYWDKVEKVKDL